MATSRSLLFVAHTFPPAAGSGAHRALAFSRYLPANGWNPVVLTPRPEWAALRDDGLLDSVPPGLAVVRTRSFEPRPVPVGTEPLSAASPPPARPGLSALKTNLAHAMRFPDAHVGWTPFAVAAGLQAIRKHGCSLLYSTSAPFTNHVTALILHRLTGLPWVMELRDGWYLWNAAIFPDYPGWRHALERRLEAACVRSAGRVLLVTEKMVGQFRWQYADLQSAHFAVIPNGFDGEAIKPSAPRAPNPARFEVVHAGSVYFGRSAGPFIEAAGRLAAEDPAFGRAFRLRLLGALDEGAREEIASTVAHYGLEKRVAYEGQLPHAEALAAMRGADLLLLLANTTEGAEATVPGKLFEYLAVRRPVLAVAPRASETEEVVSRTRAGWLAAPGDPEAVEAALRAAWRAHAAGEPFEPNEAEVARFERSHQAAELAALFDRVAERE